MQGTANFSIRIEGKQAGRIPFYRERVEIRRSAFLFSEGFPPVR